MSMRLGPLERGAVVHEEGLRGLPKGIAFHESLATEWAEGYAGGSFGKRRRHFQRILRQKVRQGDRWLDLGCGAGVYILDLIDGGAICVVGVDGSAAMLREAARVVGNPAGIDLSWNLGPVESLPYLSSSSFDGVICSSVIEYVESPEAVIREVARLLKPGGCFVLSVPPKNSVVRAIQKLVRRAAHAVGRDVFSYLSVSRFEARRRAVPALFGDHGLAVSRVTGFDPVLPRYIHAVLQPSLLIVEGRKPAA